MDCSRCENIQEPVNHMPSKYAPKPSEPPTSEETSTRAVGVFPGKSQKLTPCQSTRNWCHQCKLRWNSLSRWIGWSFLLKQHNISIIRHKEVLPGHTTFAAWWTLAPVCCTMSGLTMMPSTPTERGVSLLEGGPLDWRIQFNAQNCKYWGRANTFSRMKR